MVDTTGGHRYRNRMQRLNDAGLSYKRVVMSPDDAEAVRAYARQLYERRGIVWPLPELLPAAGKKDES